MIRFLLGMHANMSAKVVQTGIAFVAFAAAVETST